MLIMTWPANCLALSVENIWWRLEKLVNNLNADLATAILDRLRLIDKLNPCLKEFKLFKKTECNKLLIRTIVIDSNYIPFIVFCLLMSED